MPRGNSSGSTTRQVEMNAATIASHCGILKEKIAPGIGEVGTRVVPARAMDDGLDRLNSRPGAQIISFCHASWGWGRGGSGQIHGHGRSFGSKALEDVGAVLQDVLQHIEGFADVSMTNNGFPLRLVRFMSPAQALAFFLVLNTDLLAPSVPRWRPSPGPNTAGRRLRGSACRKAAAHGLASLSEDVTEHGGGPVDVDSSLQVASDKAAGEGTGSKQRPGRMPNG